jgi:hypothetical protein
MRNDLRDIRLPLASIAAGQVMVHCAFSKIDTYGRRQLLPHDQPLKRGEGVFGDIGRIHATGRAGPLGETQTPGTKSGADIGNGNARFEPHQRDEPADFDVGHHDLLGGRCQRRGRDRARTETTARPARMAGKIVKILRIPVSL